MADPAAAAPAKTAMVVGVDDGEHSFYALQWTVRHFFSPTAAASCGAPPLFKLIVVHAKPTATAVIGLGGLGAADAFVQVEMNLKRTASRIIQKAKEFCTASSIMDAEYEIVEGDARNVLCDAVERHQADMLVVGSHGYGAIKRTVLGSASDYCAHHAHCTVMIVKKPKLKH